MKDESKARAPRASRSRLAPVLEIILYEADERTTIGF